MVQVCGQLLQVARETAVHGLPPGICLNNLKIALKVVIYMLMIISKIKLFFLHLEFMSEICDHYIKKENNGSRSSEIILLTIMY